MSDLLRVELLVFCGASYGGLADYAQAQVQSLASHGYAVLLLAPEGTFSRSALYQHSLLPSLPDVVNRPRWLQQVATAITILRHHAALCKAIQATGARKVLFTTYSEYLAPLWAWQLQLWRRRGVYFGAVVHDPVRDFVVGPRWWHRLSISQGYSFLDVAFVHAPIKLDTACPQPQLRTQVIPHGPYRYPAASSDPAELRRRLAIPPQATLLLSFGHIRDNKNLQLILQAMAEMPELWLLVAGPEATAGQWPSAHYRQLAEQFGVAHRCRWQIGYQSPQQVADLFTASDAVLLTYSGAFRSASGVLHLAAHYRKPMIASAGASALLDTVRSFNLGVVVPADDAKALVQGIQHWLRHPPAPDWQGYEAANSWERNAELVAQALGLKPEPQCLGQ